MTDIKLYTRDESNDYLFILKSLNEIPFPVGKNLLADFLHGNDENKSILKNKLYDSHNFSALDFLPKDKIIQLIDNLVSNSLIDVGGSTFNKFVKVLSISQKGQQELISPTLNSKKVSSKYKETETNISDSEIAAFKELEEFLRGYNMEQKKAIISPKEKILCIAGAGSGKTSVLTKRIQFLNKYKKVRGEKILAITFTRKARTEMQKRLESLGIKAVVETFNSFSEKILLKYGGKIYGRRVRLAGYQEKMMAILRALDNQGISLENAIVRYFSDNQRRNKTAYQLQNMFMNDCFSVFEYFKTTNKKIDKIDFGKDYGNAEMIINIVKYLEKHMQVQGLRTYADQVNDTINFFKLHPKFIPEFDNILVDEFQDVNSNQVELLDLLKSKNLFCVGDPRQSIFGWRGSDVNYILDFKKKYPLAEIINLKKNYRSNSHIVNLMNKSIQDMKMPDLESSFEGEKHVKLVNLSSEKEEFEFVIETLLNLEIPLHDAFVLARTNRQLTEFSQLLKAKGVPHILKNDEVREVEAKVGELTLATIHSIKGLEAELVFVVGCTPNNFPCKSSDHPIIENLKMYEYDREEEERRLFYVAISRARNKLYLTYTGKRCSYFIGDEVKGDLC
jgi:superfamily I DNA/RNA helicase